MINRFGCRGRRLWITVTCTGVLGWGCSTGEPAGAPAGVRLDEISRLGCLECDTAELFGAVLGVASGPAGALAVLTAEEPHLRVAASPDDSLAAFGFSGEGPGELSSPMALAITRDGELAAAGRHIDRFSMRGEHLERQTRGEDLKAGMSTLALDASPDGQHVIGVEWAFWPIRSISLVRFADHLSGYEVITIPAAIWAEGQERMPFSLGHAVSNDGAIAVGSGRGDYHFVVIASDGAMRWAKRDVAPVRRSTGEVARLEERAAEVSTAPGVEFVPSEFLPHFNAASLRFDSAGRLWIRTFRGGESETIFDLFSPSLEYMGEVRVPERIEFFDIGPTTMAGLVAGPEDIPTVVVWRIRDEP